MKLHNLLIFAAVLVLIIPSVMAHETSTYRIGDNEYKFVVGSLDEPIVVDQKTGVDLRVSLVGNADDEIPVEGLENTLKAEASAAGKKKVFDLEAAYGQPGTYKANFIPTVQTALAYRFFGTINDVPVDLSFACSEERAELQTEEVEISENVVQTSKRGGFGCPESRQSMGFPEPTESLYSIEKNVDAKVNALESSADNAKNAASSSKILATLALILAVAGIGTSVFALKRKK